MRSRRARAAGGGRIRITVALAAAALLTGGCGSGGDDGPSERDYFGSVDTFCREVTRAAARVTRESAAVAKDTSGTRDARFDRIRTSLERFADATEAALGTLADAGVPSRFATYEADNEAGFRRYVATLRNTARRAAKDPTALTRLEERLKAIALPDPPPDITRSAKACASFDPSGG